MIIGRIRFSHGIVLMSLFLILSACGPSVTATPVASLPANTPVSTDIAPTDSPTTPNSFLIFPAVTCCRGQSVDAGIYQLPDWLEIPLSIEVGKDWRVLNEEAALLFLIGRGRNIQNNPNQMIVFLKISSDSSPEMLIQSVQNSTELESTGESAVEIAGFRGLQVDSTAKPNPEYVGDPAADIPPGVQFLPAFMRHFTPGFAWTTSSPEAQIRTIALTIGDRVLLVYLEAPQDEFDALLADADAVLQSLKLMDQ